jgi:hypothetical protein
MEPKCQASTTCMMRCHNAQHWAGEPPASGQRRNAERQEVVGHEMDAGADHAGTTTKRLDGCMPFRK